MSFESRFHSGSQDLSNSAQRISQPAPALTENSGKLSGLFQPQQSGQMENYGHGSVDDNDQGFEHRNFGEAAISTPIQTPRENNGKRQQTTEQYEIPGSNKTSENRSNGEFNQDLRQSELSYRRSHEENSANSEKLTCYQEGDVDTQTNTHTQQKKIESSMVSKMPEASAAQTIVRSKKEKPVVSAETKARWAMLRSLAGSGKDEEDGEGGPEEAQEIRGSGQKSVRFDASTREGSNPTNKEWPPSERRSPSTEEQTLSNKKVFEAEHGRYVRSSKAAVESALRRSGSGRHQRPRGELVEPESSISRAASVKRYMEKLRTDPHIDEIHFDRSAISANQETGAEDQEGGQYVHQPEQTIEYAADVHEGEGNGDHQIKQNIEPRERQFEGIFHEAEGAFGQELHTPAKVVERDVEKHERAFDHETNRLRNDSQDIKVTIDVEKERLGQNFQTLEEASDEGKYAVGSDLEHGARDVGRTPNREEYFLGREAHRLKRALGKEERDAVDDMKRIESDVGREEHEIKYGDYETSRIRRVSRFESVLSQGGRKVENDAHRIEGARGVGQTEGSIHQEGQQMRRTAHVVEGPLLFGGLEGPLEKEGQKFDHNTSSIKSALDLGEVIEAGGTEDHDVNHDTRNREENLSPEGHSLGQLTKHEVYDPKEPFDGTTRPLIRGSSYHTSKTKEDLDRLGRRIESSPEHGGHVMKHALGDVEAPLLDQDMRHQQEQDSRSNRQLINPQTQLQKSPHSSQRKLQPGPNSVLSHQEATSDQQLNTQQILSNNHVPPFQRIAVQEQSTPKSQSRQQYREQPVKAPIASSINQQVQPSTIEGPEPMQLPIQNSQGPVQNLAMSQSQMHQISVSPPHSQVLQDWQQPLQQPSRTLPGQNNERQPGALESVSHVSHMSPCLDPSEAQPSTICPHTAIFEQLILGFVQSSNVRLAASGGSRGFLDQMTELLVTIAEDALPAIRQRLEENARH